MPVNMFYNPTSIATILVVKDVLDLNETSIYLDSKKKRSMYVKHKNHMYKLLLFNIRESNVFRRKNLKICLRKGP